MHTQKYINMAYGNPDGKLWLTTLYSQEFWNKWVTYVSNSPMYKSIPSYYKPEVYAHRILVEAVWCLGYNPRHQKWQQCARRLRLPPRSGTSPVERKTNRGDRTKSAYGIPWEFIELDNFLEQYIRPEIQGNLRFPE